MGALTARFVYLSSLTGHKFTYKELDGFIEVYRNGYEVIPYAHLYTLEQAKYWAIGAIEIAYLLGGSK